MMRFEQEHPHNDRTKEALIRQTFGVSWVRYQQTLFRLIQTPAAAAEFPNVVRIVTERTERLVQVRRGRRFV